MKNCKNCDIYLDCQRYQMFKEVDFGRPIDANKDCNKPEIEIAADCCDYVDSRVKISKRDIDLLINNFSFLKGSVDFKKCSNPLIQVAVDDIDKILAELEQLEQNKTKFK